MDNRGAIETFWGECRRAVDGLPKLAPDAWAFGATPGHADELLGLVVSGMKIATASSLWDFEASYEPVPEVGSFAIILDGNDRPVALVQTAAVSIVPFDEVTKGHAYAEGEGDRTLASWREIHERYWRTHAENPRGFDQFMPVVCVELRLVYALPS